MIFTSNLKGLLYTVRLFFIEIVLSSLLINTCGLIMPLFSMLVYDKVVNKGNHETLYTLVLGMLFILFLEFILRIIRSYATEKIGAISELRMDSHFIERMLQGDMQVMASSGTLISRYRDHASARDLLFAQYAVVASDLPFLFIFLVAQYFVGGDLVIISILFSLPIFIGQGIVSKIQHNNSKNIQNASAYKASLLSNIISGLAFLKVSSLRHVVVNRWENQVYVGAILRCRQRFWSTALLAWSGICLGTASVTLLTVGVYRIEAGIMSVGVLIACSLIQLRTMIQVSSIASFFVSYRDVLRTREELNNIAATSSMDSRDDVNCDDEKMLESIGDISIVNVSCGVASGEFALRSINLFIAKGERVAIIGKPGSGKSTLLKCIAGVQLPSEGKVLMNGMKINAIPSQRRSQWMTYKPQEPMLIGPTLHDDLKTLKGERAELALHLTGLATLLKNGELCLEQDIYSHAEMPLSVGQRQIISLSQALSSDSELFLLDEPTSGVDSETEIALVDAVDKCTNGRTTVIVTHSLALLKKVDRIIVLERGRVVANGPREQFINN